MTNLELLEDLRGLCDTCLRSGMVKVVRYESCIQIIVPRKLGNKVGASTDTYKHYFQVIPINIKRVCWTTPKRCKKLIDLINYILNEYVNKSYLVVQPIRNGSMYKVKAYNIDGKCIKKWKINPFVINIGSSKPSKLNTKNKGKVTNGK